MWSGRWYCIPFENFIFLKISYLVNDILYSILTIFISNILSGNSTIPPHVTQSLILYTICGIFFSFILNNENYYFFSVIFVPSKWYIVFNTDILHQQNTLEKYFHSTQCDPVADIVYHLWWIFYFLSYSLIMKIISLFWRFCIQ